MIHTGQPDVHIPDNVSLYEFVLTRARKYGDKIALIDGPTGRRISYNELFSQIDAVGSALYQRGLRKGDVVLSFVPNCIEYVILFYAVIGQGAIISPCNHLYTPEELGPHLEDSDAVYIFTHTPLLGNVMKALETYKKIREIFVPGGAPGCVNFSNLTQHSGSDYPKVHIDPKSDLAILPYSSGTTGRPKGVMITHYNLVANFCQILPPQFIFCPEGGTSVLVLPFTHLYGIVAGAIHGLIRGCTTVILPRFKLDIYLEMIEKYQATFVHVVPPIVLLMAKDPQVQKYTLSSLTTMFCAAAILSQNVVQELRQQLPYLKNIIQVYGMTEVLFTHICPTNHIKDGSIGIPMCSISAKVVDADTDRILGPNEQGELCVRGPQIMKGYHKNPQATASAVDRAGWLHTGDLSYYDDDGHFYIVGRLKEIIKYKGSQVAPATLEALLLKHPAIVDAAVVGVPDEMAGELPRAYVVKHQGASITAQDVIDYVKEHLNPRMWLRGGVVFIPEVPKSTSGKILRRILIAQIEKEKHHKSKL